MSDVDSDSEPPDASTGEREPDHGVVSDEEKAVMKANLDLFTGSRPADRKPTDS